MLKLIGKLKIQSKNKLNPNGKQITDNREPRTDN
jgi:hypothetical protein